MSFPKKDVCVNLLEQRIQLAPEIHSWSPESNLNRCVVRCCLHTLENYPSSVLLTLSSPLCYILDTAQQVPGNQMPAELGYGA